MASCRTHAATFLKLPPTEPTERTEISCREETSTDGTDAISGGAAVSAAPTKQAVVLPQNARNAQKFCRRVWHPAVPTQPLTQPIICENLCNLWENCIPTEPTERTEASCREGSPTDCTDLHRCRRVWHPAVPTQPLTQPNFCVDQCNPWENCIPTERTEPTEASCREGSPTDGTDLHRFRRVWHPAVPTQPLTHPNFCEFCEFRGRINATNHLC